MTRQELWRNITAACEDSCHLIWNRWETLARMRWFKGPDLIQHICPLQMQATALCITENRQRTKAWQEQHGRMQKIFNFCCRKLESDVWHLSVHYSCLVWWWLDERAFKVGRSHNLKVSDQLEVAKPLGSIEFTSFILRKKTLLLKTYDAVDYLYNILCQCNSAMQRPRD